MNQNKITVTVSRVEQLTPNIKQFEFTAPNDDLGTFTAGSHVSVHMDEVGIRRAYSLTSNPQQADRYSIAVLLDENSRGGSAYMHQRVSEGDTLQLSPAENFFPLVHDDTSKHVLIAGGIGITPFLSYLYELEEKGLDFELHYSFRDGANAAFVEELRERLGDRLFTYDNVKSERLSVGPLIEQLPAESHVYVCGPQPLIDDVIANGNRVLGEARTHFENFGEVASNGDAFEVHFHRSGFSLQVGEGESILQAIEADKRVSIECLCRNGVCGTCETTILEGEADHRDHYLDEDEQAAQETMMICVSRAKGKRLVLDL
ncbi:PDR/VanB family oxidoreductase [Marinobacterium sediminicola]|uniref:Ferredoxin-NADP reductase n=1 Tax=Marinobacterium sediminicola TaxID=518898 RepID=A0ABY1RYQ5_9GAMM|nr:PDR/VanB family oxidoreductase [Marinobacterium sediminicola]ULG68024.1 PDR/VanB family oxidoreductase [Marinobacterium sediminicola]SMR73466.1 Ferredoxin-NADP reductase [Marinobacterium sediminicola]